MVGDGRTADRRHPDTDAAMRAVAADGLVWIVVDDPPVFSLTSEAARRFALALNAAADLAELSPDVV